jgi:predicted peptidase
MRFLIFLALANICLLWTALGKEPVPGKQVPQQLKTGSGSIEYFLYLPKDYKSKAQWPLMLFLHGRSESEPPLATVKKWGPPELIERGVPFHYIIASPQCPPKPKAWSEPEEQALLVALLDHLCQTTKVDKDKIYLAGLSMGGSGVWRLAASDPNRFAAVLPLCGRGDINDAEKLKSLPIWIWCGTEDRKENMQTNLDMVAAVKKAGGSTIRMTTLEGIGHNCWEAAFASPDVYAWLDKQSASKNRERAKP